ncbi:hypothetical protein SDC9_170893 [bioreactor metagenome]|uniref:Uncharacterized protein n=1 Tax=bioreactor metagenome TaxID=1076179 RepID=A0A645GA37_9ZZZZ
MNDVERFLQVGAGNYTGDIGFTGSLCQGNHADAVSSQCAKKLAGNTGYVLHVLSHDGDGGKVILDHDLVNAAHGDLVRKFLVEYFLRQHCVL